VTDPIAAGTDRLRWAGAHVLVAAAGTAWLLLVAGLALGVVHGLRRRDIG
jgi:ABC-2 type transport system permease protein